MARDAATGERIRTKRVRGRLGCACGLVLLLSLATVASADRHRQGPPGGPPSPGRIFERHAERLALTPETSAAIQEIVERSRIEGEALRKELERAHGGLRALLDAEPPDEAAALAQNEEISRLELQERQSRLHAMLAIRALLTPEQRSELVRIQEERGPRRGRPRGPLGPCREDLAERCPDARGSEVLLCLATRYEGLSDRCRAMLEDPLAEHGRGPHGSPPGSPPLPPRF